MAADNKIDEIMGSIDYLKAQAYDRLIETIGANMESLSKEDIINIFNEFIQDLKIQNNEITNGIYESNNTNLAVTYAHCTQNHISRVDATVDQLLSINKKNVQEVSENALPGNALK